MVILIFLVKSNISKKDITKTRIARLEKNTWSLNASWLVKFSSGRIPQYLLLVEATSGIKIEKRIIEICREGHDFNMRKSSKEDKIAQDETTLLI